jgi:AcrR family transcriptional regulator
MRSRYDLCPDCKVRLVKDHWNAKRCTVCAEVRATWPTGKLTSAQARQAMALRGKMKRADIAKRLGVSVPSLYRFGRDEGISFALVRSPEYVRLVERVSRYYERHGRKATEKRFPDVRVRSIIERYPHAPRQIRWTGEQIIQAAKMAGLVSMERQAKIFNRPGTNQGAIRSLWTKRFRLAGGNIHGVSNHTARALLRPGYPAIRTQFWITRNQRCDRAFARRIVLWCDMEPWLLPGTPLFLRDAVRAMAEFQRWLFKTQEPRRAILALLRRTA